MIDEALSRRDFLKMSGLAAVGLAIPKVETKPNQAPDPFAKEFIDPEELLGKGNESIVTVKLGMDTPHQTIDSSFYVTSTGSFDQKRISEQNEVFFLIGPKRVNR